MESNGKMKLNNLIGLISHFEGDIRSTLLIDGYYETTKLIYYYIIDNCFDRNTLIYPFLYLTRHYYELSLKYITDLMHKFHNDYKKTDKNFDENEYNKISKTHNLEEIYKFIKDNLYKLDNRFKEKEDIVNSFEDEIKFFYNDDKSDAFRYAKDLKGTENLPDIEFVNYTEILESLEKFRGATSILNLFFNSINNEYNTKTTFKEFSRLELKQIAKDLPKYDKRTEDSFDGVKKSIKQKFNINSSGSLTKILDIIKENKSLSFYIGYNRENYDEKYKLLSKVFKSIFDLCELKEKKEKNFLDKETYLKNIKAIKDKENDFVSKLSLDDKALIFTYYKMGNEFKYSEDFDSILNETKQYFQESQNDNYFIVKIYNYSSIVNILSGIYRTGDYELFLKIHKYYKENCKVIFPFNNFEDIIKEIEEVINK